jgi:hypothetical protein
MRDFENSTKETEALGGKERAYLELFIHKTNVILQKPVQLECTFLEICDLLQFVGIQTGTQDIGFDLAEEIIRQLPHLQHQLALAWLGIVRL